VNPTVKELIDYEEFCGLNLPTDAPILEEITAAELNELIKNNPEVQVIDVREPHEFEIARIPNTKLIPLGQVTARAKEIDPSRTAYLHCKGGVRSAKAIAALQENGYTGKLVNLKGGITAWSDEVDATVPKY
jgi:adenylyltransferase/sulfurtransferase